MLTCKKSSWKSFGFGMNLTLTEVRFGWWVGLMDAVTLVGRVVQCQFFYPTPKKAQKSRQFWHLNWTNVSILILNLASFLHKLCKSSPKKAWFAKLLLLANFLPQPANIFTRIYPLNFYMDISVIFLLGYIFTLIYPSYLWHFATLRAVGSDLQICHSC